MPYWKESFGNYAISFFLNLLNFDLFIEVTTTYKFIYILLRLNIKFIHKRWNSREISNSKFWLQFFLEFWLQKPVEFINLYVSRQPFELVPSYLLHSTNLEELYKIHQYEFSDLKILKIDVFELTNLHPKSKKYAKKFV